MMPARIKICMMGIIVSRNQQRGPAIVISIQPRQIVPCLPCRSPNAIASIPERVAQELATSSPAAGLCFLCGGHLLPLPESGRLCQEDIPCSNAHRGCLVRLPTCRIFDHERKCCHKRIVCKICAEVLTISGIKRHYKNNHEMFALADGVVARRLVHKNTGQLISRKGQFFWFWCENRGNVMYLGITYLGLPANAKNYKYYFMLMSRSTQTRITFSTKTHSVLESEDELRQEFRCCVIGEDMMNNFREDGRCKFVLAITIKDVEVDNNSPQ